MAKGRTLSYWQDAKTPGQSAALFVRESADKAWMLVGIYSPQKANEIYRRDYSNWPSDCAYLIALP